MISMYETLMDLPLLKGITREQVSDFLMKTHLEFTYPPAGEIFINEGDECNHVMYVISGGVRIRQRLAGGDIIAIQTCGQSTLLGADILFGMKRTFPYSVESLAGLSILKFSKEQYLNLLKTGDIYMINYVNYLSLKAQRPQSSINMLTRLNLSQLLGLWISALPDQSSETIFDGNENKYLQILNIDSAEFARQKEELTTLGLINPASDSRIIVRNCHNLTEHALPCSF